MSVIAEYTIEPPSYAAVIRDAPEMRLIVKQIAAYDPETVSVTFWAEGDDFGVFETHLEQIETIKNIKILSEQIDGQQLYQIRIPAAETTYWEWIQRGGVLLACTGTHGGLAIRMRFPDREAVAAYRKDCLNQEMPFNLTGLHSTDSPLEENHHVVTSAQHEIIVRAAEQGYFEVPRKVALCDLADRFDISDQAASERLRRGLSNLIKFHQFEYG
jgi:predicted DNA binding protein